MMFPELSELARSVFGGDTPQHPLEYSQIAARSLVIYAFGIATVRIGKSRLLARVTPLDLILGYVLGSLLSRGITGSASLSGTAVAAATLVAVHWGLTALACRSHWLGNLIKGHAHELVRNGEVLWENMRRSHISEHDLVEELRLNANVDKLQQVASAYKERSGEIGVVLAQPQTKVIDVAVRDGVQTLRIVLAP